MFYVLLDEILLGKYVVAVERLFINSKLKENLKNNLNIKMSRIKEQNFFLYKIFLFDHNYIN